MTQRPRIERRTRSGHGIQAVNRRMRSTFAKVGILSGTGEHPNSTGGQTIAEVAWWIEFGTRYVDARPFLRTGLRENLREYRRMMRIFMSRVANGEMSNAQAIGLIGAKAASDVQSKITSVGAIDSGQTRQHITWAEVN